MADWNVIVEDGYKGIMTDVHRTDHLSSYRVN